MLIFWDNTDKYKYHNNIQFPNLIWDDENERFICIRPATDFEHYQFPVETVYVPYEHIQYIKVYNDIKLSREIIDLYGHLLTEDDKKVFEDMFSKLTTVPNYQVIRDTNK